MATLRGYAVKTHAALPIALPSIIHLAGRFQLGGGPHSCLDGDGRLHDRAFLDVTVLPKLRRSERQCSIPPAWTALRVFGDTVILRS